jgi:hypothetical protein
MPSPLRSLRWAARWLLALCLTACASGSQPPTDDPGWVELEEATLDEAALDRSVIERVTPGPVEPVTMSHAEAQAALPFEYALPGWAPEGFVLDEGVEVILPAGGLGYTSAGFTWLDAAGSVLYLQIEQRDDDQPALGAAGSSQAVTVNGQPAVLLHTRRLGLERLSVTWTRGDLTYVLSAEAGVAAPEDLLRMADSVA